MQGRHLHLAAHLPLSRVKPRPWGEPELLQALGEARERSGAAALS